MAYKIGDKVRIKNIDWYNTNKDEDGNIELSTHIFMQEMSFFCGSISTIKDVFEDMDDNVVYYMEEMDFDWTDEMIDGLASPLFNTDVKVWTDDNLIGAVDKSWWDEKECCYMYEVSFAHVDFGIYKEYQLKPYYNEKEVVEEETYDFLKTDTPSLPSVNIFLDILNNEIRLPDGYVFKDESGNTINAKKIVLEKKDKLYLESTKIVREYWSEYARIFIEIYEDKPNECVLTHLYVIEEQRKKGYGKQALIQAENIAKELGCHTAYLKVEIDSWMYQWYLRCGYRWYKKADDEYAWLVKVLGNVDKLSF